MYVSPLLRPAGDEAARERVGAPASAEADRDPADADVRDGVVAGVGSAAGTVVVGVGSANDGSEGATAAAATGAADAVA